MVVVGVGAAVGVAVVPTAVSVKVGANEGCSIGLEEGDHEMLGAGFGTAVMFQEASPPLPLLLSRPAM
jgi:hypothetical protein